MIIQLEKILDNFSCRNQSFIHQVGRTYVFFFFKFTFKVRPTGCQRDLISRARREGGGLMLHNLISTLDKKQRNVVHHVKLGA